MPKDSKLDSCHEKVKKALLKSGKTESEANREAWAICKQQQRDEDKKKVDKEREKNMAKAQKDKAKKRTGSSNIKKLKDW